MSFGFPAYHTEHVSRALPPSFRNLLDKSFRKLGWLVQDETDDNMTASTGYSPSSWGEHVSVRFDSLGYTVTSRCILVTQCFDWGRNRWNVRRLIQEINEHIQIALPPGLSTQAWLSRNGGA